MPFLNALQVAEIAKSTVRIATLAEFQFRANTMNLWNGIGDVPYGGKTWQGLGGFGSVDGFPNLHGTDSAVVTAKLSAVDATVLALAANSKEDVAGRPAYFWFQLLDENWAPVGALIPAFAGIMQRIKIERTPADEQSGGVRVAGLEIENLFAARGRSGAGRYTDTDQQYRFPGDPFCGYVSDQKSRTVIWPNY